MTFPFSLYFNRKLNAAITSDTQNNVLDYIKISILDDKADNILIEGLNVTYKGSTSNWRGSLFGSVDDGIFSLIYKEGYWWLIYRINMHKLFISTIILSTIMGVFAFVNGGPWWAGMAAFLWLCGANWFINLVRHGLMATNIAEGIDRLIHGKTDQPEISEPDKMTGGLKSWF